MKKIIWTQIIAITFTVSIIAGLVGGALTNEYLIAYLFGQLTEKQEEEFPIVKKVIEEKIYVEESSTIAAIEKASSSIVQLENGRPGVILTTDGIVATCNTAVLDKKDYNLFLGEDILKSEVVYRQAGDNFAFLKIKTDEDFEYFETLSFVEDVHKDLTLGQKVLTLSVDYAKSGIIEHISEMSFYVHVDYEINRALECAPAINLAGELVGLTIEDRAEEQGTSYVVSTQILQQALQNLQ